jgi:hypothetical protein
VNAIMENAVVMEPSGRRLTNTQFQQLADVPPAMTWFANISNPQTQRAYQNDLQDFMKFTGIVQPEQFRIVTRAHVLAWRKDLEGRALAGATIHRKLAAVSSLYQHLCEVNAVLHNPLDGVKRPRIDSHEGKTPAIGDHQARAIERTRPGDATGTARPRDPVDAAVPRAAPCRVVRTNGRRPAAAARRDAPACARQRRQIKVRATASRHCRTDRS